MQPTNICYSTHFPILIVAFGTKHKNNSLIWNLVLPLPHHCLQKHALTDVTSFEAYVIDVVEHRFEKVRIGSRFEDWTSDLFVLSYLT